MLIALIPDTYFNGTYMHRAIIRCNNIRVYMGCLMSYFEKKLPKGKKNSKILGLLTFFIKIIESGLKFDYKC